MTALPNLKKNPGRESQNDKNARSRAKNVLGNQNRHEEEGEGTWIFSYADMITILMMFFILLLSISSVDAQKFKELQEAVAKSNIGTDQKSDSTNAGEKKVGESSPQSFPGQLKIAGVTLDELIGKTKDLSASDRSTQAMAAIKLFVAQVDESALQNQNEELINIRRIVSQLDTLETAELEKIPSQLTNTGELTLNLATARIFNKKGQVNRLAQAIVSTLASGLKDLQSGHTISISSELSAENYSSEEAAAYWSNLLAVRLYLQFRGEGIDRDKITLSAKVLGNNNLDIKKTEKRIDDKIQKFSPADRVIIKVNRLKRPNNEQKTE